MADHQRNVLWCATNTHTHKTYRVWGWTPSLIDIISPLKVIISPLKGHHFTTQGHKHAKHNKGNIYAIQHKQVSIWSIKTWTAYDIDFLVHFHCPFAVIGPFSHIRSITVYCCIVMFAWCLYKVWCLVHVHVNDPSDGCICNHSKDGNTSNNKMIDLFYLVNSHMEKHIECERFLFSTR